MRSLKAKFIRNLNLDLRGLSINLSKEQLEALKNNEDVEIVDNTFITITEFLGICVKVVRKGVKGLVENRFIFDGAEEHDTMEYYAEFLCVVSGYCVSDCINSFKNNKRVLFPERQILKKINKVIKLEKECDDEGRYEFFSIWGYVKVIPEPFAAFVEVWNGQKLKTFRVLSHNLNSIGHLVRAHAIEGVGPYENISKIK